MEKAAKILDEFEIPFEINALSAHRTPEQAGDFAKNAYDRGIRVVIAGAGGAAHLPGVIAALTPVPVIGVPVKASISIDGWDSLLVYRPDASGNPCRNCWPRRCHECRNPGRTDPGRRRSCLMKKVMAYKENLKVQDH